MPENAGYYEKYRVERTDGKPITGRTFTLEIDRDPFALPALIAYRDAALRRGQGEFDLLTSALTELIHELAFKEYAE